MDKEWAVSTAIWGITEFTSYGAVWNMRGENKSSEVRMMGFQFLLQTPDKAWQLFNKVCQRTIQPPGTTYNTCISMYRWVTIIDASVLPVSSDGKWTELLAAPTKTCYFKAELKLKMSSGNHRCIDATITWHVFPPLHFKKKLKIFWGGNCILVWSLWLGVSFGQHLRTSITDTISTWHMLAK